MRSLHLLNSSLGLAPLLKQILKTAGDDLAGERSTLYLIDPPPGSGDGQAPRLRAQVTVASGEIHFEVPWGEGIVGRVVASGVGRIVDDAYRAPDFFKSIDQKTQFRTRNLLTVPMRNKDGVIIGALQVLNKRRGKFTRDDLRFLSAFADHGAVAIERERLLEAYVRNERLREQVSLARQIQQQLLPPPDFAMPQAELHAFTQACDEIGGDLFDYYLRSDGHLLFSLGDVSGKGVSAALLMSAVQVSLRALWQGSLDLQQILSRLNDLICRTTNFRSFVTLFVGDLDPSSHRLRYVNAGHLPPLKITGEKEALALSVSSRVVGLLPESIYDVGEMKFDRGNRLVIFSDGFSEAFNPSNQEFGMKRLQRSLLSSRRKPAAVAIAALLKAVEAFADGRPPSDDRTLVLLDAL